MHYFHLLNLLSPSAIVTDNLFYYNIEKSLLKSINRLGEYLLFFLNYMLFSTYTSN